VTLASLSVYESRSATEADRQKLESWLRQAAEHKPTDMGLKTKLASLYTKSARYAAARAICRQVLETNKDNLEALNNLAWLLALHDQNAKEALTLANRAIDLAGHNPTLLDTRAVVFLQLNQAEKALDDLRESLTYEPDKPRRYFHLAQAYQMALAPAEARKALERSKVLGLTEETVDPLERGTYRKLWSEIAVR
jgi:cellulose synthase operon protein C